MSRNPVFSHEELVCKMAADPDGLDLDLAKAVYSEMLAVVEQEANRRHRLTKMVGLGCNSCFEEPHYKSFQQSVILPINKQLHMKILQSERA